MSENDRLIKREIIRIESRELERKKEKECETEWDKEIKRGWKKWVVSFTTSNEKTPNTESKEWKKETNSLCGEECSSTTHKNTITNEKIATCNTFWNGVKHKGEFELKN